MGVDSSQVAKSAGLGGQMMSLNYEKQLADLNRVLTDRMGTEEINYGGMY